MFGAGSRVATIGSGNAMCNCISILVPVEDAPTESTIPASVLERLLALPAVRLAACRADAGEWSSEPNRDGAVN